MFSNDKPQTFSINKVVMTEKWTCIVKEIEAAVHIIREIGISSNSFSNCLV